MREEVMNYLSMEAVLVTHDIKRFEERNFSWYLLFKNSAKILKI